MPSAAKKRVSVVILADQLSPSIASLDGIEPEACRVVLVESLEWARRLPHHKQKLVLVWSAMRHFADELREMGFTVDYYQTEDSTFEGAKRHIEKHAPATVRLMESAEYHRAADLAKRVRGLGVSVDLVPNTMFISDKASFQNGAAKKKSLLMERFYRRMRRETGLLMDGDEPEGGEWNYDKQNRERPSGELEPPEPKWFGPDTTTRDVIANVQKHFPDHFGSCEDFAWPVTRKQAETFLDDFLDKRLDLFGPFQDAMVSGEPYLYHALISPLLNIGLLDPLDVCRKAESRYKKGEACLNSVEGFIRQILGWREFVYQVYHLKMPEYIAMNHFGADIPLPDFYWDADTDMRCVSEAVGDLREHGINHHIQRLMITGNFALIAGLDPEAVNEWYWLAYADAWEWVVTPNVIGMALYADGGILGTKPYAASANYINKMSDYCGDCPYNHREALSDDACPFNSLYWDFLARNAQTLKSNPRIAMIYKGMKNRDPGMLDALRKKAAALRKRLRQGKRI